MSNTITAEELSLIASLKTLPEIPTVTARSMLIAQTVRFTTEERTAISLRANVFAKLGMPGVNVPVLDHSGVRIGELVFKA